MNDNRIGPPFRSLSGHTTYLQFWPLPLIAEALVRMATHLRRALSFIGWDDV